MSESWKCPYCQHYAVLSDKVYQRGDDTILYSKLGRTEFQIHQWACPNAECRQLSLRGQLWQATYNSIARSTTYGSCLGEWSLLPSSRARPKPDFIPPPIYQDYEEASKICDLSPKASATLARRCLQGMIRDFWGVTKNRLIDEIEAIRDKVDGDTWASIDAVRALGNIGAHMEKDINLIVDVDADEAETLLELIEQLFDDWYGVRAARLARTNKIRAITAVKTEMRRGVTSSPDGAAQDKQDK